MKSQFFTLMLIFSIMVVAILALSKEAKKINASIHGTSIIGKEDDIYLFGVVGSRKPYNYEDEDGKLTGFDVDIVAAVCAEVKRKCSMVLTQKEDCIFTDRNIDYAGPGLMSEAIQGCVGYQITRDRQNEFSFTLPYLNGKSTYAVAPGNPKHFSANLTNLSKFRLAHSDGSPFNAACLIRQGKSFESIIVTRNVDEARQMVMNGTADVLLSTLTSIALMEVLPTAVHCDEGRGTGLLLKKGSSVSQWWNYAFHKLYKSGDYHKLCKEGERKYGGGINCLSSKEKATNQPLDSRIGTQIDSPSSKRLWKFVVSGRIAPFSFIDKTGELVGFTKDFILNVCKIAGKQCALLLAEVNECSVRVGELLYPGRGLVSGWFDACTGYFSTVDRRNSWDFTDPYLISNASFYVAPGNPKDFNPNVEDLSNFTIVYQATAITNDHCLHRLHKRVGKLLVVNDSIQAVKTVLSGKAEAWFTKLIIAKGKGLLRLSGRYHCENVGTSVMVRKGSELPSWWNKAFRQFVSTGDYHKFCQTQGDFYHTNFPCIPPSESSKAPRIQQ